MSAPGRRIAAFLDARCGEMERLLAELVKTPSDNPPGDCAPHAERTAALLEDLGFSVERHSVPASLARSQGQVSCVNLIVRQRFGEGPTIALNAHGDVVPPGDGWTQDPYGAAVVDGWMYGRGVAVSKSDFVTYAYALLALMHSDAALRGCVELHLTYDEEAGGEIGPAWLLNEKIVAPDLAIAAGFSYAIVTAHNGCLHLEAEIFGRSAHAATPDAGVDALQTTTNVLSAIYAYRQILARRGSSLDGVGSPQVTVGLIKGGINTNVVPDKVTFRLDRRIIPEETPEAVEAELRALIERAVASTKGARVEIRRILLARPLLPLPGANGLIAALQRRASAVMGGPVPITGSPLYTDARHYAAHGVPIVLYGAGPRSIAEANAHRADERLRLSDLRKAAEAISLTLLDLLQQPDAGEGGRN
jgi:succinyl-diaminopimelate desuccinylase